MTRLALLLLLTSSNAVLAAEPRAVTRQMTRPVLIRNEHNSLIQLTIAAQEPFVQVKSITVAISGAENLQSLQWYSTGADASLSSEKPFGDRLPAAASLAFRGHLRLTGGANHLWLSCRVRPDADMTKRVDARVVDVETTAGRIEATDQTPELSKRTGIALRKHWDDGVHTYRIAALATSPKGTLLCAYDMRRRVGRDLQEDIDIGLLRSTDGGRTWGAQQVIMDMGEFGGLGQEVNGCSDPGLIVDPETGEIFCFAVWMNGRAGTHQWNKGGSEPGFEIGESAQFMMVTSQDDGLTWSKPRNMTRAWKKAEWILYAPSPQQGIALTDGTLVMPTQGRDAKDRHFSNLLISRDHGKNWTVSAAASLDNTECQAVQLADGSIMLNCRTESPTKFRTVAVTRDLGKTWRPHATNRNTIIEPNCNGSTYRFDFVDKGRAKSVLLFANPHSQKGRTHHSIQVSFDEGETWPAKNRLLLDEGRGAGYPSLSRVDDRHIGIVYEGSGSHLVFEKIEIGELVK
ncbi:MAG: exo-alpha-sialidase [Pirellulaceae bacterium]|jgi:sialidase-1|nr:exo-alpha-sialidase [Pirellulaceae bacterium]MDP7020559.1 exo-alpha-sialidase [Pirellulaceae bacterium]